MGVLDAQGAALADTVLPLLNAYGQRLDGLDEAILHLQSDLVNQIGLSTRTFARFDGHIEYFLTAEGVWLSLTFGQRLRWLLTGRLP